MSRSSTATFKSKIDSTSFYSEWKGHPINDLAAFHNITLAERSETPIVYFAGDSSLDNKAWVNSSTQIDGNPVEIPEIYNKTLQNPTTKPDVAFWMNHLLGDRATCINTAVEESILRERKDGLLPHDEFIRDNIRSQDVLIVSVGANDVVLKPAPSTIRHLLQLAWLTPRKSIQNNTASSLAHFKQMFGSQTEEYISRMTAKKKPRAVIACMIYYPLEAGLGQQSWADRSLKMLGYASNPEQLQAAIRTTYEHATKNIKVEGTKIIPYALFEVLDGKDPADYKDRVEPNSEGGRKMASKFVELLGGLWDDTTARKINHDDL
jgi:lysophospholipase L1-like esterase